MPLPLENIVVLDLTQLLPGPYCTMILADMGAKVIRIQNPKYLYAGLPPFYHKEGAKISALNTIIMRNKKSIALDLKNPASREIFYDLTKKADIVIEGFRPGVVEKLGIDYNTLKNLNQKLIYCSLTGYGQNGPYRNLPGHDLNYVGLSGNLVKNRPHHQNQREEMQSDPVPIAVQTADIGGSFYSALGILGALVGKLRHSDFKGEYIDISMLDSAFAFNPWEATYALAKKDNAIDMVHGEFPAYNIYRTKDDKFLSIGNVEHKFWVQFCEAVELPQLGNNAWSQGKLQQKTFELIRSKLLTKTQGEWMDIFSKFETCVMPIKTYEEALEDPQLHARNMIQSQSHPLLGEITTIGSPIQYKENPLTIRSAAPEVGENTKEILKWIGYTQEKIHTLHDNGCFGA